VGAKCLAEVLILIPGCELSAQLRKDMVKSFFGAGGQVTFENLLSNPRIQAHLRGSDNPLAEFLEDGEHKVLMRTLPRLLLQRDADRNERDEQLQLVLKERDEQLQQIVKAGQLVLKERDEQWQQMVFARDDRILSRLAQQCEQLSVCVVFAMQRSVATALQPLLLSLQPLGELLGSLKGLTSSVSMSVRGAVKDVIDAAVTSADSKLVKAFRAATKAPAKRKTSNPSEFPESQRASPKQKVNILTLAKVAMNEFPQNELHFNTWEAVKSGFGKRAKAERMRCNGLGPANGAFVAQPLLWCNGVYDGCMQRYMYLESQRPLLQRVWHFTPPRGESLHDRAVRLQQAARSGPGYVEKEWPEDVMEQDPSGWKFEDAAN
jgi:hypothetical protein